MRVDNTSHFHRRGHEPLNPEGQPTSARSTLAIPSDQSDEIKRAAKRDGSERPLGVVAVLGTFIAVSVGIQRQTDPLGLDVSSTGGVQWHLGEVDQFRGGHDVVDLSPIRGARDFVSADEVDRTLRGLVEDRAGRRLTDDEWRVFKDAQLATAAGGSPKAHDSSDFLAGVGGLLGFLLIIFVIGVVVSGLYLGLVWAYDPDQLQKEDLAKDMGSFFGGAAFVGLWAVFFYGSFPKTTAVVGGLFLVPGVIALLIGAIIRVA